MYVGNERGSWAKKMEPEDSQVTAGQPGGSRSEGSQRRRSKEYKEQEMEPKDASKSTDQG